MNVTRYVTRDRQRDSRQTFGWYTDPTRSDPPVKYSTSLRAATDGHEQLGRVINGLFGSVDEAAS